MEQKRLIRLCANVVYGYSRGILRGAAEFFNTNPEWEFDFQSVAEPGLAHQLSQQHVAGALVQIRDLEMAREFIQTKVPIINVSNVLEPLPDIPSVICDDAAVGRMAAAYFLERGYRQFGYSSHCNHRYARQRGEAFIGAIEAAGFSCPSHSFHQNGDDGVLRANWLHSATQPLAIFCTNDSAARETVLQCIKFGINVPDQVAVLGVDNDEINRSLCGVPLSSIRLNTEEIGNRAASMLVSMIKGEAIPQTPILVPPIEVITRRSTDSLALADKEVCASVRFIRDRGGREINVQDLLGHTTLSRRSLEMRFRKALGRSPYQEIRRVQIECAKLLLTGTDRNDHSTTDAFGFTEPEQSTAAIHEKIVMPRQYRRRAKHNGDGQAS